MSRKGTTKNKGRKDELDRFYTEPDVACDLVASLLQDHPEWAQTKHFVEPSAGDGAFVYALERSGVKNIYALDIAPAEETLCETKIIANDFLDDDLLSKIPNLAAADKQDIVFIGNPPFGEQATLAIAFVKRSLELGGYCAFILPPSFRKESVQKKFASLGAVDDIKDIDNITYRVVGSGGRDVPSFFFVFDAEKDFMPSPDMTGDLPFEFLPKTKKADADFAIRRVGGTAGTPTTDVLGVSEESYYFCKIKDDAGVTVDGIIAILDGCEFPERDWSVGPRTLSQKEIARNYCTCNCQQENGIAAGKLEAIGKKIYGDDYDIYDRLQFTQEKRDPIAQAANNAAIERFGKEFTYLHHDVLPLCDNITLPLTDAEMSWVAEHVRRYGWKVFDESFDLSDAEKQQIAYVKNTQAKPEDIHDVLLKFNRGIRENK